MKKNNVLFLSSLIISIIIVVMSFATAYADRGYIAGGGEVFTIALPIFVVMYRVEKVKRLRELSNSK